MKVRGRRRRSQAGFTLVELMISLVLFSFVVAGVLSVAVAMVQAYREQRQAIAAEGAVRVPLDFLADALRQASPGVSVPANVQDAGTCSVGAITVVNSGTAPDELDLIYAAGAVVTSSRSAYTTGTTSLDVTDASQLTVGAFILITDFGTGHLVEITGKAGNTLTLAAQCGAIALPGAGYAVGSLVVRAQHARFTIADLDGIPTLWMDPDGGGLQAAEPLAEGIEDLQVAIGVDADAANGISETGAGANDDEWSYNFAGEAAPAGTIRAVRVTLVARASQPLLGNTGTFTRPAAEDRAAAGSPDAYRRRTLRTIVELRNIGGSP